jgi:hypothetical protein
MPHRHAAIAQGPVLRRADDVCAAWLTEALGQPVTHVSVVPGAGNWSQQATLRAELDDGTTRWLRLKICVGQTFGRSEVDYYTRDYVDLAGAPLVRCFAARFEPGVGYHLLLDDLSDTHHDRRDVPPTVDYGCAVAQALAAMHRHHWETQPAPSDATINRYLDEIRPGIAALEAATGRTLQPHCDRHEQQFRERWTDPRGMSLLHGDLNPTNVLTPKGSDRPVCFIDRQPFDWSLTYGLAVSDLAYFMAPWWPEPVFRMHAPTILRHWYDSLNRPDYGWAQAQDDWRLSVAQCLNVPLQWCSKDDTRAKMRWLWEAQLARIDAAMASHAEGEAR